VIREILYGRRRFDQIQESLGISRATLSERLVRLENEQLLERVPYQDHPPRFEYRMTDKCRALWPVLAAMWAYGSEWLFDHPTPGVLVDRHSGEEIRPVVVDATTGDPVDLRRTGLVSRPPAGPAGAEVAWGRPTERPQA
jgi:DNA-binding HxlR family transcriptional regulator